MDAVVTDLEFVARKPKKVRKPRNKAKHVKKAMHKCLACPHQHDAETVHPVLSIPICGACKLSFAQRDRQLLDNNEASCLICGRGDDNQLLFCDTCPFTYCNECIERNFGAAELQLARDLEVWSCYLCSESPLLRDIQLSKDTVFYSLDAAYGSVHPPNDILQEPIDMDLVYALSAGELLFASLFCNHLSNQPFADLGILSYLSAPDILPKLFCLSKKLRAFFKSRVYVLPGLFQTEYGHENLCKLHPHQQVSLHEMLRIENSTLEFGALRGGIFADEPGLGKTVTALALISCTAGTIPCQPMCFWDDDIIEESWRNLHNRHEGMLAPIINTLGQTAQLASVLPDKKRHPMLASLINTLRKGKASLGEVEAAVKKWIRAAAFTRGGRDQLLSKFAHGTALTTPAFSLKFYSSFLLLEWSQLKVGLDTKRRKTLHSSLTQRMQFERKLFPSCATLIIVPSALLEHWYEQTMRHLSLRYFEHGEDNTSQLCQGVVYLDGLGDIVDVQAPLSRLMIQGNKPIEPATVLSNYLIVVTTLERCALEHRFIDTNSRDNSSGLGYQSHAAESPLLRIRWLRLIIDEGHELGRGGEADRSLPRAVSQAAHLISHIAAERRWIMSGTPTTGAHSDVGLKQLHRLLQFLRHPVYGTTSISWHKEIIDPCLQQDAHAWEKVQSLLRELLVRHTKSDINLFEPVYSIVNMEGIDMIEDNPMERRALRSDRAKAHHIAETIKKAKKEWLETLGNPGFDAVLTRRISLGKKEKDQDEQDQNDQRLLAKGRRPKAIVFSQHESDLQGVGHFLYMMLGDSFICEHFGPYQSAELSRFRHSKRKTRCCTLCGHRNTIVSANACEKVLVLVEYTDVAPLPSFSSPSASAVSSPPPLHQSPQIPFPGGHGINSRGGHYNGRCLCSPTGCVMPCNGLPNPFYHLDADANGIISPNLALVAEEHIQNYVPGLNYQVGDDVYVTPGMAVLGAETMSIEQAKAPVLWYGGRRGGRATIKQWRRCGGTNHYHSWHGNKILPTLPWQVDEEDAAILLLKQDGSTGLDLSFATHIFLLDRITDPALRNQIVSRAHRVGATGPVHVQLLQVVAVDQQD